MTRMGPRDPSTGLGCDLLSAPVTPAGALVPRSDCQLDVREGGLLAGGAPEGIASKVVQIDVAVEGVERGSGGGVVEDEGAPATSVLGRKVTP
jgi:hypothetical protein